MGSPWITPAPGAAGAGRALSGWRVSRHSHWLSPAVLVMPATALALLVTTSVAALPALLAAGQAPSGARSATADATTMPPLVLARSGQGVWFLHGQPIAPAALAQLLRSGADAAGRGGEVRLLAGSDLSLGEVAEALQWLRRHSQRPVRLEPAL